MALPPRSMSMAMSMALPTPPNSGKEEIMHSFSPQQLDTHDAPLFGPVINDGRRSPSDVAMMRGQTPFYGYSTSPRQQKPTKPLVATSPRPYIKVANAARQHASPPMREPAVAKVEQSSPHQSQARPTRTQPQSTRTTLSTTAFSPEEIDLLIDFTERFHKRFKVEAPFLRMSMSANGKSWLEVPDDLHVSYTPICESNTATSLPRGHKRKDSGLGDSPRKKIALTPVPKRRALTPKSRAATPAHGVADARKRLTLSETHNMKGDNRPTRQAANKSKTSTDYRDWPDFTPPSSTLDSEQARSIASRFDIGLMPKTADMSHDPLRHELHEVELEIIRKACLDTSKYLFAKRSIFVGYLKHLLHEENKRPLTALEIKKGLKSWNKTAAQNNAGIDVNKVSKLFEHFWTQVGWFDRHHFEHYLQHYDQITFPEFDADGHLIQEGGFKV